MEVRTLKRFIPIAVCAALIALIIAAPAAITGGIHKSVYTLRASKLPKARV